LGNLYKLQRRFEAARDCYEKAIAIKPDYHDARLNRGILYLLQGNFSQGWSDYEQRFFHQDFEPRTFEKPQWDGLSLAEKRIRVVAEQGYGDIFQFIRYLPLVKARGGHVIFECYPEVYPALINCPGVDELVMGTASSPAQVEYDTYVFLLSLPMLLGTTLETIPSFEAPLSLPDEVLEKWQQRLGGEDGFKVGIVWKSRPEHHTSRHRSCNLRHFGALTRIPGVRLYSLQKGIAQAKEEIAKTLIPLVDLEAELINFAETAAAIAHMDLVISVDTAVVHVAGVMGRPVWVLLNDVPDWRWFLDREDSPWYPSARLFRQSRPRDWNTVLETVIAELAKNVHRVAL
jgi:hypothetical protein